MTLLAFPLAAMAGGIVGAIVHESLHALAAATLGHLVDISWRGSMLTGGPVVDFQTSDRWRTEVVLKSPLVAGVALIGLVVTMSGVTLTRVALAGAAAGLLWTSPEDVAASRARR